MKKAELLLHPVRMRIIQALLGGRQLTTAQLQDELRDVPPATLYRQVAALLNGGALEVADERRVRGTYERSYRLRPENSTIDAAEAAQMSTDEHAEAFLAYVTSRLADFDRYLTTPDSDLQRDRVGYRVNALHLSDAEVDDFVAGLRQLLEPLLAHEPAPGRRRRIFSTILLPADES